MLGPFSVDTYLPAFPAIGQSLSASQIAVQQTLTAYMASFAIMILWHGALSDAFGRRRPILISLVVYALASLGCALAQTVEQLWAFRMLQGMSAGAGVVIGRAIVRDRYAGAEAERMLALVTMIFSVSPAIAPLVGGWVVLLADWHAIFVLLCLLALGLLVACWRLLPETLPSPQRQPFRPSSLWNNYRQVFLSVPFQLKAGAIACNFSGLFLYVASAPAVVTRHLGLGPGQFGWLFIPSVVGIFLGALAANRMAGRAGPGRQVRLGFMLLAIAGILNLGYHALQPAALPWTVVPLFVYTTGMSLVAPALTLRVLDLFPQIRGTVASCQSFTMTLLSAAVAGIVSPLLDHSMLALAAGQFGLAMTGLLLWRIAASRRPITTP